MKFTYVYINDEPTDFNKYMMFTYRFRNTQLDYAHYADLLTQLGFNVVIKEAILDNKEKIPKNHFCAEKRVLPRILPRIRPKPLSKVQEWIIKTITLNPYPLIFQWINLTLQSINPNLYNRIHHNLYTLSTTINQKEIFIVLQKNNIIELDEEIKTFQQEMEKIHPETLINTVKRPNCILEASLQKPYSKDAIAQFMIESKIEFEEMAQDIKRQSVPQEDQNRCQKEEKEEKQVAPKIPPKDDPSYFLINLLNENPDPW